MSVFSSCQSLQDASQVSLFSHGGLKQNTGYLGEPMAIDGVAFEKGILIHPEKKEEAAFAEAIYDLAKHPMAKRFRAFIGLEDHAKGGSITFAVEVKRGGKWQRVFETGTVDRMTPLQKVDIDLTGAEQLRLTVGDAGNGIGSDHAAWGGARLE